MPELMILHWLI